MYPDQQLENGTTDHEVGTQGCTLQGSLERIVTLLSPLEMTLFITALPTFHQQTGAAYKMCMLLPFLVILAAPEDYMGTSVDLTFSKTVRRDCVTIPVRNDSIAEPPEVYTVVINSTDPDVRLPTPMSTVTIEGDDGGTLQSQLTVEIGINGKTFFCFSEVTVMFGAPSYTFEDGIVGMVEVRQSWSINC